VIPRARRASRYIAALVLTTVVAAALIPSSRTRMLRVAGRSLVVEDPLDTVDAIVVTVDAREAGVLEAADLVNRRVAPRVAVMAEPSTTAARELAHRGVDYDDGTTTSARYLKQLGVADVERIPGSADGTHAEGTALREWCLRRQFTSVIVVSTTDHARRVRRVLRRSMRGSPTRVLVRSSRFSSFDPDSWWLTRTGIRTQIVETEKLLLDLLSHPLS
jgi:hypothetical protein